MSVFAGILRKHGVPAVIDDGTTQKTVKAFLEPIMSRAERMEWVDVTRLGERNISRWYWFGPPESDIDETKDTVITVGGTAYTVLKAAPYTVNGEISHWEAVLRKREEEYVAGA